MIERFRQSEPGPDHSTLHCPCGSEFTWSGFSEALEPWMQEHSTCVDASDWQVPPPTTSMLTVRAEKAEARVAELEARISELRIAGWALYPFVEKKLGGTVGHIIQRFEEVFGQMPSPSASQHPPDEVWHYMPSPGVAFCGADYPNMNKTANRNHVSCKACGAAAPTKRTVLAQAGRVVRAWEDDPTSIYTENAIRELNMRNHFDSSASDGRTQRESVEVTRSLDRGGNERRPSEQGVTAGETAHTCQKNPPGSACEGCRVEIAAEKQRTDKAQSECVGCQMYKVTTDEMLAEIERLRGSRSETARRYPMSEEAVRRVDALADAQRKVFDAARTVCLLARNLDFSDAGVPSKAVRDLRDALGELQEDK